MTTGIEYLKPEQKKRGRGPSKKPTLVNTSLRLPREVVEYFETFPNKQAKIREVLVNYVETQIGEFENGNS
jgi:uncharacterized protein (DUF4415 family)